MKIYWVMQSTSPMRILCSDGMIRKNLKHAPEGVVFKKFRQFNEPSKSQVAKVMYQCQRLPYKFALVAVYPDTDGFSERSGKIRYGMVAEMRKPINELLAM